MHTIETLIKQIQIIIEKHNNISKISGKDFNIFSILKIGNKEDIHSYFIYELLNSKGTHYQDNLFLNLFIKKVLGLKKYGEIQKVSREEPTRENRRVDFYIETTQYQIGIEMKIDASDQDKQLYDYYHELKNRAKQKEQTVKLYYLTLDGKDASAESVGDLKEDDYELLSFQYDILNWLSKCIEKSATIPSIREVLVHYRNLIRKLTHIQGNKMALEINNLIKTEKDIEAIYTMYNQYPLILAQKEADFWFELYDKLDKKDNKNYKIRYYATDDDINNEKIDYNFIAKKKKEEYLGLTIKGKVLKNLTFKCVIYKKTCDEYITMDITLKKSGKEINLNSLSELLGDIGFSEKGKNEYRYFELKEKVNFFGNYEPTFELFDNEKFQKIIDNLVDEIKKTLDKIYEYQDEILQKV